MKPDIKEALEKSNLDKNTKKELKSCSTRADLTLTLSKCIFKKRVTSKPNYEELEKLDYLIDDKTFNKNVNNIIKKL